MTGLLNTAPTVSNVGALLAGTGSAKPEAPAKLGVPLEPGAVPFLNLLWLFGGDAPIEIPVANEAGEPKAAQIAVDPTVTVATPQLIAGALIRSMLNISAGTRQNISSSAPGEPATSSPSPVPPLLDSSVPVEPLEPAVPGQKVDKTKEVVDPGDGLGLEETSEPAHVPELSELLSAPVLDNIPVVPVVPSVAPVTIPPIPAASSAPHVDPPEPDTRTVAISSAPTPVPVPAAPVPIPVFTESPAPARVANTLTPTAPWPTSALPAKLAAYPTPRPVPEQASPLAFALRLTAHEETSEGSTPPATPAVPTATETPTSTPLTSQPPIQEANLPAGEEKRPSATTLTARPESQDGAVDPVGFSAGETSTGSEADPEQPESKPQQEIPSKSEREPAPKSTSPRVESAPVPPPSPSAAGPSTIQVSAPHSLPQKPSSPAATSTPETAPQAQAKEAAPGPEARTGSTHEIAVRISAPDAVPVDLHIAERGGEVRVAVRTADAELQASLRQDLGTLVDRLEHSGFHAETLVLHDASPSTRIENTQSFDLSSTFRAHAITDTAGAAANRDGSHDSDSSSRQQNQPDSGARQQQQQRRQSSAQHSKWMEAMIEPAREEQTYDN